MPTAARLHLPGSLVHVVSRILNREFLISGPAERRAYLDRIPDALDHSDWRLLAFALMSNHIHLALIAGDTPPARIFQRLHRPFAGLINRTLGRLGPVFAARPLTVHMPRERAPALIAYIHNNPVRAGLVAAARETDWTSHRIWIGEAPVPSWLDVDRGFREVGHAPTPVGRRQFDAWVLSRAGDPRDGALSGDGHLTARSEVRASLALPVEVTSPVLGSDEEQLRAVRHLGPLAAAPRWSGDLDEVVRRVSLVTAVPVEWIRSRCRIAEVVDARRLVCAVSIFVLRRATNEVAAELGVAASSVSNHIRLVDEPLLLRALLLAEALTEGEDRDGRC